MFIQLPLRTIAALLFICLPYQAKCADGEKDVVPPQCDTPAKVDNIAPETTEYVVQLKQREGVKDEATRLASKYQFDLVEPTGVLAGILIGYRTFVARLSPMIVSLLRCEPTVIVILHIRPAAR